MATQAGGAGMEAPAVLLRPSVILNLTDHFTRVSLGQQPREEGGHDHGEQQQQQQQRRRQQQQQEEEEDNKSSYCRASVAACGVLLGMRRSGARGNGYADANASSAAAASPPASAAAIEVHNSFECGALSPHEVALGRDLFLKTCPALDIVGYYRVYAGDGSAGPREDEDAGATPLGASPGALIPEYAGAAPLFLTYNARGYGESDALPVRAYVRRPASRARDGVGDADAALADHGGVTPAAMEWVEAACTLETRDSERIVLDELVKLDTSGSGDGGGGAAVSAAPRASRRDSRQRQQRKDDAADSHGKKATAAAGGCGGGGDATAAAASTSSSSSSSSSCSSSSRPTRKPATERARAHRSVAAAGRDAGTITRSDDSVAVAGTRIDDRGQRQSAGRGGDGAALSTHLTNLRAALSMLHARVRLIRRFLDAVAAGDIAREDVDPSLLREASALCAMLPPDPGATAKPSASHASHDPALAEWSDTAMAMTYLTMSTRALASARDTTRRYRRTAHVRERHRQR